MQKKSTSDPSQEEGGGDQKGESDAIVAENSHAVFVEISHHPLHGEHGTEPGGEGPDEEGGRAVGFEHGGTVAEAVIGGCGGEGEDSEEEAEFDGCREAEPHEEASNDGDEAAADSGPHGQALGDADDDGHAEGDLFDGEALGDGAVVFPSQPADQENGNPADEPGGHNRPESPGFAEKILFNCLFEDIAESGGGDKGGKDGGAEAEACGIFAQHAASHLKDAFVIKAEDGENRASLDADGKGVSGFAVRDAEQALGEKQVACGTDREIFGQSFDHSEDQGVPPVQVAECGEGRRVGSDGVFAGFLGADADGILEGEDEDFAVANFAGFGGGGDGLGGFFNEFVGDDDFEFDLREEIDGVLTAAVDFRMAFLASESLDFGDGHSLDADFGEGFFDVFHFERFDDCFDFFHRQFQGLR